MKKATRSILSTVLAVSMAATACPVSFAATTSNEVTAREKANAALAREAAAQGMVLLENKNNSLPIKTKKLALFGGGAVRTVRGGTGSGDPFNGGLSGGGDVNVNQSERYNINIYNSFKKAGYDITTASILEKYAEGYDVENAKAASNPMATFAYPELTFTDEELAASAKDTNTAVYVISRNAGEGADRGMTKKVTVNEVEYELGDYELSDVEKENLKKVASAFENTIVVLNVGGVIDTKFFEETEGLDSLLLMGQGGQEGGNALLDVVTGAVTPSGKLTDTWAIDYKDYPASATISNNDGNSLEEFYQDDIFVGYRYFDTFGKKVAYEFGYGLSYTDFEIHTDSVEADEDQIKVSATVTNTGTADGKEVVEVYFSAPDGELDKPYQELAGYKKVGVEAGKSQKVEITFDTDDMASYDEKKEAYVMEPGDYTIRVGNSSRNNAEAAKISLDKEVVTEYCDNELGLTKESMEAGSYDAKYVMEDSATAVDLLDSASEGFGTKVDITADGVSADHTDLSLKSQDFPNAETHIYGNGEITAYVSANDEKSDSYAYAQSENKKDGEKLEKELPVKISDPAFLAVAYAELCVRVGMRHIPAVYPVFTNSSNVEL